MLTLQALMIWVLIGLAAGGARRVARGESHRMPGEVAAGIIGAVLGGLIFVTLGLQTGGVLGSMAVALVGAVTVLLLVRTIRAT